MKQVRLIWMIPLAAAIAIGCGTTEAGSSIPPVIGTGGTGNMSGGTGGTGGGGTSEGACTNEADAMVYEDLATDEFTGQEIVSAEASACVFGSCSDEAFAILAPGGNTPENQDALAVCVVACTAELAPLTPDCLVCYGDSVVCSAANCASAGCTTPTADSCVRCREQAGCFSGFDECSGLP
jgi:hypothetical protein